MVKVWHKGTQSFKTAVTDHSSEKSLHYICMQVQLGLAMNMNNKTVVSTAVGISSALRMLAVKKNPPDRPPECGSRCQAMPGQDRIGWDRAPARASWLTD